MKGIVAVNLAGYIGLNDGLPWKCLSDLQNFKEVTMGCTLLTGYNTSLTLPKLKGRTLIVDPREMLDEETLSTIDWCIGGRKTYEKYMHLFTELHVSLIHDWTIGDVKSPEITNLPSTSKLIITDYFI